MYPTLALFFLDCLKVSNCYPSWRRFCRAGLWVVLGAIFEVSINAADEPGNQSASAPTNATEALKLPEQCSYTMEMKLLNIPPELQNIRSQLPENFGSHSFKYYQSGEKTRTEMGLPSAAAANETGKKTKKQAGKAGGLGIEHSIIITDAGQKTLTSIYPDLKSYVVMLMPAQIQKLHEKDPNVATQVMQKEKLGEETIDGRLCYKYRMVTRTSGTTNDSTVWFAKDLPELPVRIQNDKVIIVFRDIALAKPDAKLFEAPASYTRYDDMQKFVKERIKTGGGSEVAKIFVDMLVNSAAGAAGGALGGILRMPMPFPGR